jgi:SAM-dependent methyltransferase
VGKIDGEGADNAPGEAAPAAAPPQERAPAAEARPGQLEGFFSHHEALRKAPLGDVRKAWFTMAHLLLSPSAHVLDIGCGDGGMTYAMAALHPELRFTGIDPDRKKIAKAQKSWQLENLSFACGEPAALTGIEPESADAVVNSYVLHKIYSEAKFSERAVMESLEKHLGLLKPGGLMFLRDYALPPHGNDYALMEMPDVKSAGPGVADMSEADLLVWYADNALASAHGCHGFFLEELPKRVPNTRLFRLPLKWACEFINRKDDRAALQSEIGHEYAFLTTREFRRALRRLGSRVVYSSPHWDDTEIQAKFTGRFRLYSEDGAPLGPPPTSYVAVTQKIGERESVQVHERRTGAKAESRIQIRAMRNELTGRLHDIVSRDTDLTEIVPYRVTETGRLNVFVHEGLPRAIVNAVPRNGREIDGKRWSGHMTEAVAVPTDIVLDVALDEAKPTVLFARDYLGLRPAAGALLEEGPS